MRYRGFTLVELLAVIVVIGLIIVIAAPIVSKVIVNADKDSFKQDAKAIIRSIEYKQSENVGYDPTIITKANIEDELGINNNKYESIVVQIVNDKVKITLTGTGRWERYIASGTINNITVKVRDIVPPVITLVGSSSVNINQGSTYTDAGATATDNEDGNITNIIVVVNPVNTAVVGTYTVTYNVTDDAGNNATQVTRTVRVLDITKPIITLVGSTPVNVNQGATYTDQGATATDNVDGNITNRIVTVNPVNTAVVATYTVTYNVTDDAGNTATQVTRTVNVLDITPPVIALVGSTPVNVNQGSVYTDQGATASDNVDGNITNRIVVVNPVNTATLGTYTVTYNVADNAGNNATQVTRTVNVNPVLADSSGANAPVLLTNMIPVKWSGSAWVKADTNNYQGANEWYSYNNKVWANAVMVTSTNRATYQSAAAGTTINMSDILTFFVWIPRYRYALPSGSGARAINIVFETKVTSKSTGTGTGTSYYTHPAFTFNGTELSGIWVGKFDTTGSIAALTIIPNTVAVKSQTVSAMFNAARAMQNAANTYGFDTAGLDTHMMKNIERGAVANLAHSTFGVNGEIWINPANNYTSGCAGDSVSSASTTGCLRTYDTTNGVKASTTGNISGVYDMSGGANEYVMGNYNSVAGSSGFSPFPAAQYFDKYTSTSTGFKGDATNVEGTNGWYSDSATFLNNTTNVWFLRGGSYSNTTSAGLFNYTASTGASSASNGFRVVVTSN